jgi:hypothetical protein
MSAENGFQKTGFYVVAHYGEDGRQTAPLFLKNDIYHFTASLANEVAMFMYEHEAELAMETIRDLLNSEGKLIGKHLKVLSVYVRDYMLED